MIKNKNTFHAPNSNSNDANIKKVLKVVNQELFTIKKNDISYKGHICVCSGGTTSGCAKNGLITLDLRTNYGHMIFDKETGIVKIGGGVLMGNLSNYLENSKRIFPIGLSPLPGVGYILTGGISPLSKRYGLAIDNLEFVSGYFGNGKYFSLKKDNLASDEKIIWDAIRGAAPFFSIITELGLKTNPVYPIISIEGYLDKKRLKEVIEISEEFPENFSLQWLYGERIYIYIIAELKTELDIKYASNYKNIFRKFSTLKVYKYESFNKIKFFPKELDLFELNKNNHSEVISLIGKNLGNNSKTFIEELIEINIERPNKSCYVASQQLGSNSDKYFNNGSLFIHGDCTWKPWIYASWGKNDLNEKEIALNWMYKSWSKLKKYFPNIHLAQLHNHLDSHKEEINLAFGNRLNDLKRLKNFYDPYGILPPL